MRRVRGWRRNEAVTELRDRLDHFTSEELAQDGDVLVETVLIHVRVRPDRSHQFPFRHDMVGRVHQNDERLENLRRDRQGSAVLEQTPFGRNELERTETAAGRSVHGRNQESVSFFSSFCERQFPELRWWIAIIDRQRP